MLLFKFLLVVHALIAAGLVTVILLQRSEGGGLGMGGSPSGLMSARGAADFLTRATSVLATMFVVFSIILAVLAAAGKTSRIDTTLARAPAPTVQTAPVQAPPPGGAPFAQPTAPAKAPAAGTAAPADNGTVPLAQ